MTETGLLFRQMLRTLRDARQALQAELGTHAGDASADTALLARLQNSAEEFADQAASLVRMMKNREVERDLIHEAEALARFFQETEHQVLLLLGVGRG